MIFSCFFLRGRVSFLLFKKKMIIHTYIYIHIYVESLLLLSKQHSLHNLVFLDQESSHHSVLHALVASRSAIRSGHGSFSLLGVDQLSLGHFLDALEGSATVSALGDGSLLGHVLDNVFATRSLHNTSSVRTGVVRAVLSEGHSAVFSHG